MSNGGCRWPSHSAPSLLGFWQQRHWRFAGRAARGKVQVGVGGSLGQLGVALLPLLAAIAGAGCSVLYLTLHLAPAPGCTLDTRLRLVQAGGEGLAEPRWARHEPLGGVQRRPRRSEQASGGLQEPPRGRWAARACGCRWGAAKRPLPVVFKNRRTTGGVQEPHGGRCVWLLSRWGAASAAARLPSVGAASAASAWPARQTAADPLAPPAAGA